MLLLLSHVWPFATPWTVTRHAPCDSPGKNTGVGCHVLQGISRTQERDSSALEGRFCTTGPPGEPEQLLTSCLCYTWQCICQCNSLNFFHPLLPLLCPQVHPLICISIPALQTGSQYHFSRFCNICVNIQYLFLLFLTSLYQHFMIK